jgi:hypothetical protein
VKSPSRPHLRVHRVDVLFSLSSPSRDQGTGPAFARPLGLHLLRDRV